MFTFIRNIVYKLNITVDVLHFVCTRVPLYMQQDYAHTRVTTMHIPELRFSFFSYLAQKTMIYSPRIEIDFVHLVVKFVL